MKYSQNFYRVAANAIGNDIARVPDDKFASTWNATGSTSAWLFDELINRLKNAANNQPGRSDIVSCDVGGFFI